VTIDNRVTTVDRISAAKDRGWGVRAVERRDLIQRIRADESARIVGLVAPAGYGKSTTLSQWIAEESIPSASLAMRRSHNDPAELLNDLSQALAQGGLLPRAALPQLQYSSATALSTGVRRLRRALEESPPGLLAVDQLETLQSRASRDVMAELALVGPSTLRIALASRSQLPIAVGAIRVRGELLEITIDDLAMSVDEAGALAEIVGVDISGTELAAVVQRTEGWPAGLYLSFLAIRSGASALAGISVGGDDRFIAQYLRSEVLNRLTPARRSFLMETSVLEEVSADVCDFVLERTDSERVLRSLAGSSRFVIPVDRIDHRYRYHQLLLELLRSDLRRREPKREANLHLRAAQWFDHRGLPSEAIHHAIAADSPNRVADFVQRWARTVFADGRAAAALEWIDWLEDTGRLDEYPGVALLGALASAMTGDPAATDRFMAVVDATNDLGALAPLVHLANALLCRNGIERALADAETAEAHTAPSSEWHPPVVAVLGLTLLGIGETEAAQRYLETAARAATRFTVPPTATIALATLASLALERGETTQAEELANRALDVVHRTRLETYATSVLAYVVAARCALRCGEPGEAQELLGRALARRPTLTAAIPLLAVQALVEIAEIQIEIGDYPGARQVSRTIGEILAVRSVGALEGRYREVADLLDQMPVGHAGAATLTNAELRLLPLLATHLSFREIGDRLFISRHTVKTEAMSIYRKLGASSRSEAVEQARALRLIAT
jgi:LuxR family maltose regulon positive regulatory protein